MPVRGLLLLIALGAAAYALSRPPRRGGYGSNTNASEAVDAPELLPDATDEDVLDVGIQYTFPASDPVAVESAFRRR
jgi:hypothetical protein